MYKFRLTLSHITPGFFDLDSQCFGIELTERLGLEVYPRNSDILHSASNYHIDCGGFGSESDALVAGEKLRIRLRLINSILDLGLDIPTEDSLTGSISEGIKKSIEKKGGNVLDPRKGLSVIPDDGLHFEAITSGKLHVTPSDPLFIFDATKEIWDTEFVFDSKAEEVIELLNLSSKEKSNKLKFLTAYLALEQMIKIQERSKDAQKLIAFFISHVRKSEIQDDEKASLIGSLSNLKNGSFSGAFKSFSKRLSPKVKFEGYSAERFASKCIELRNKIAHRSEVGKEADINPLTKGIRKLTLSLLWDEYKIPEVSIYRPADKVSTTKFEFRFL